MQLWRATVLVACLLGREVIVETQYSTAGATPNETESTIITVGASTQSTMNATPLPTIAMQTEMFPNDVTVQNDKVVMQKAIALSNHISTLTAQIGALNSTLDPNNSVLIMSLQAMLINATAMNSTLINLNSQLASALVNLRLQQAVYANTSRIMNCMTSTCLPATLASTTTTTLFTGTIPAPQCNRSLTASATDSTFTFNATTAEVCSTTVSATGGTVKYTLSKATINSGANIIVVDVGSGATLKSYSSADTSDTPQDTNRTNIRFDAIPANEITYSITYSVSNPCEGYCGMNTKCNVNSQGQPICSCSQQNDACATMSGKNCTVVNPCNNRNNNTCTKDGEKVCEKNTTSDACSFMCVPAAPLFLDFHGEEREVREERGFFQRWIF